MTEQEARQQLADAVVAMVRSRAEYERAKQAMETASNALQAAQKAQWDSESAAMVAGRTVLAIIEPSLFPTGGN